ncbi:hypothetical protein L6164_017578 [Bauhinia variegata]|uniref:Uncharacterized protein n=1 Tax=Bauhinia variegata TaxID=167791 RepID=A0ACB9NDA5_BAUVA|nr:hypothetical protein L6164_017578 [Bauhinia variegata]
MPNTMAPKRYLLIWKVLFLFLLLLSGNHAATPELYTNGKVRRLAGQPPCKRSRAGLVQSPLGLKRRDMPHCHNYL